MQFDASSLLVLIADRKKEKRMEREERKERKIEIYSEEQRSMVHSSLRTNHWSIWIEIATSAYKSSSPKEDGIAFVE